VPQLREHDRALDVSNQAVKLWYDAVFHKAESPTAHPFFEHFGVFVEGLRIYHGALTLDGLRCAGDLLVPMYDRDRNLRNLAFVPADGKRRYLSREHIAGTYFSIGKYPGESETSIMITSGLVTALKARQELGHPVAVAFSADNVRVVASIMADRYQTADILILGADGKLVPFDRQEAVPSDRATIVPLRPLVAGELPRALRTVPSADGVAHAGEAQELVWAQKLMAWVKRRELTEFDRKMVLQAGPSSVRPVARAEAALAKLITFGWLETQDGKRYRLSEPALTELKLSVTRSSANADLEQSSTEQDSAA